MPFRAIAFGLCLAFAAPSAWADKEWYAHYEEARKLSAKNKCKAKAAYTHEHSRIKCQCSEQRE